MSTRVKITTPFPSVEETAFVVGVSPERTRELVEIADRIATASSSGRSGRLTPTRRAGATRGPSKNGKR